MQKQQLSASAKLNLAKDTQYNKLEGVGPLHLLMVSSKRTGATFDGFIKERQGCSREGEGTCKTTAVTAPTNGFIKGGSGCYQWFHQRTPRREGTGKKTRTAGYVWHFTCDLQHRRSGKYLFLSQSDHDFFELVTGNQNEGACRCYGKKRMSLRNTSQIQKQRCNCYK